MRELEYTVFPGTEKTIMVGKNPITDNESAYAARVCIGIQDNKPIYGGSVQYIDFVHIGPNGEFEHGLQAEQLVYILLDRIQKLDQKFSSPFNQQMIAGLEMFLEASENRILDRIERSVMGQLKE